MRIAAQKCRPPIVKLVTPTGTVILEGSELLFDHEARLPRAPSPRESASHALIDSHNAYPRTHSFLTAHVLSVSVLPPACEPTQVAPIFLEAGFITHGLAATPSSADTRRRLSGLSGLRGFFDSLESVHSPSNVTTCIPDLPAPLWRFKGHSKSLQICGAECEDEFGFVNEDLAGTTVVQGRVYTVREEFILETQLAVHGSPQNLSLRKIITRFPRYPQLRKVSVENGTHGMEWVLFGGKKYRCRHTFGWQSSNGNNNTSGDHVEYRNDVDVDPELEITYEGLLWYNSDIHREVPSIKYQMTMLGGTQLHE